MAHLFPNSKFILDCPHLFATDPANVAEAECSESNSDFIHKLAIALKEANETEYWLDLLWRSGLITIQQYESINEDCVELIKILKSIINSMKQKSK